MIDAGELTQRIRQAFAAIYHQHGRLLTIESALGRDALVAERLSGRESISECFEFHIDCVAPSAHFELKGLIGEPFTLRLIQANGTRTWHGYATRAAFLGADGGLARYRVTLNPWLSFLSRRRNTLIFQDKTALEIIEAIFADYPQANYTTEVTQALPKRPRCTQFRETDLAFVERLLAEEGLCYRFVHDPDQSAADTDDTAKHGPTLYIYDRKADAPDVSPSHIRFHRVSAIENDDTITAFRQQAQLAPNTSTLSAWDAMKLRAHAHQAHAQNSPDLPPLEIYDGTRASLRHQEPTWIEQSADQRLAAARLRAKTATGTSSARQLAAGSAFTLTEHASEDGRYITWAVEHRAANNLGAHLAHLLGKPDIEFGSYRNQFVCAPSAVDVVPAFIGKPNAPGPETALVVGVADQSLTSTRDHRVKVQFPWQRGQKPNTGGLTETYSSANPDGNAPGDERNGTWVRVSESLAGPNWGAAFVPRIGTEVLIDYLEGDIDQPMIVGQFYNGSDAPPFAAGTNSGANHPGTLSGTHTHALDNSGHNQWAHDDAPGQLRQRLATSQADSELNLGYLIDQNGATRGAYRGQGSELKTGGWAALRAPEGLLISTAIRQRGESTAHDVAESVGQLKAAQDLASRLSDTASAQQANGLKANTAQAAFTRSIDPEQDGVYQAPVGGQDHHKASPGSRDAGAAAERFATPSVLFDSPSTIATTTPASSLLYAGQNTHQAIQGEAQHTASGTYSSVSGATTSLYTHDGGIQGVAANGSLSLQAHDDTLEILADDSITTTSSQTRIDMLANSKIVLTAGQSSVTLEGGDVTFACPGTFTVKGSTHDLIGPANRSASLKELPIGSTSVNSVAASLAASLIEETSTDTFDEALILQDEKERTLGNTRYTLHLGNGETTSGTTDASGTTQRVVTASPEKIKAVTLHAEDIGCCEKHLAMRGDTELEKKFHIESVTTNPEKIGQSKVVVKTPKGEARILTSGEINMARQVFGDAIDYGKVEVHKKEYLWFGLQPDNTAMTPNGEMYFNPKYFREDFSSGRDVEKHWFIHEMTHVWQYQLGYPVKWRGAIRVGLSYNYVLADDNHPAASYNSHTDKRLSDYNMEAQGNIIADYFALKFLKNTAVVAERSYRSEGAIGLMESVLSDFLQDPGNEKNLPK